MRIRVSCPTWSRGDGFCSHRGLWIRFLCDFASHYGGLRGVFIGAYCREIGVGQL